nr:glucan biosynthesis protein G [Chachezhania sediminis]
MPFSHDQVIAEAEVLAQKRYHERDEIPEVWRDLSYDQYRALQMDHDRALWANTSSSYEVDFFPPGSYFSRSVQVFDVADGMAHEVPFVIEDFTAHAHVELPELPLDDTLGFTGLRFKTYLDVPGKRTEFVVFQGASYFRAIGVGETYGLSARGLALNTGDPEGEEFPDFTKFWIEKPDPEQPDIVVHALLDSPSVTGAYRFDIRPGASTVMEVDATLFPREDLEHVGLAPLTSMFLFDETGRTRFDDYRPAVHDSDGLLVENGNGETLWRPLANPVRLQVSSFLDDNPKGFGLMQRARRFSDFADLEARYHNRPSLWVEPKGGWGRGAVTLVEIPADREIYDNIVAYWRPEAGLAEGTRNDFSYRLTWGPRAPREGAMPRVMNTRMGKDLESDRRLAVIEFEAHPLLDEGPEGIDVYLWSPSADLSDPVLVRNPESGGLRLAFTFDPGEEDHVELRGQLRRGGENISEVWLYRWTA